LAKNAPQCPQGILHTFVPLASPKRTHSWVSLDIYEWVTSATHGWVVKKMYEWVVTGIKEWGVVKRDGIHLLQIYYLPLLAPCY